MRWAYTFVVLVVGVLGCRDVDRDPPRITPDADVDPDHPYPAPRADLVPAVGSESTLELATWNIENFPADSDTASVVADVITSLDLDIIVVEEIASETAWAELLTRLRGYAGILSTHSYSAADYQKIGVIYRTSLVTASPPKLLFPADGYAFPRPPLAVTLTVDGASFEVIGVHLKAGVELDDAERRRAAVFDLDAFLRAQVAAGGEHEIVVLGDYNERVVASADREILAPFLTAPDQYTVRTEPIALGGGITYLGFGGSLLDHITTTAGFDARWTPARVEVQRLDRLITSYRSHVSDHLPVVLIAPR
ncbi:MAG: endonuclease/exonuclease/phosphatase family protein [Myxococcales bacterium]|nr:endonuclease/exonuclease/phosphatase family protein [Myxococcales bacterium]